MSPVFPTGQTLLSPEFHTGSKFSSKSTAVSTASFKAASCHRARPTSRHVTSIPPRNAVADWQLDAGNLAIQVVGRITFSNALDGERGWVFLDKNWSDKFACGCNNVEN